MHSAKSYNNPIYVDCNYFYSIPVGFFQRKGWCENGLSNTYINNTQHIDIFIGGKGGQRRVIGIKGNIAEAVVNTCDTGADQPEHL